MLGNPRAARTVGWAMHSLPAGHDVPWHRVISSTGRVRVGAEEHAVALQRSLLEAEGVDVGPGNIVNLVRFGWDGLSPPEVDALMRGIDSDQEL